MNIWLVLPAIIFTVFLTVSALSAVVPFLRRGVVRFMYQQLMRVIHLLPERKMVWGTVYDSQTKRPIPFVPVQLLDRNNRVLETRVADARGRYGFLTTPESLMSQGVQIALMPRHQGYRFPSQVTASGDHFIYNHLYYGGLMTVNDQELINFDIPMDPLVSSPSSALVRAPSVTMGIAVAAMADLSFWLGAVVIPLDVILQPNPFTVGTLCLFLGVVSLRIWGITEHPFGIVIDAKTRKAIPFTLITLDRGSKRIAFTVSDERGRYALIADKGAYEMAAVTPATIQPQRVVRIPVHTRGWITQTITL